MDVKPEFGKVVIFGVAANVVAGVATMLFGLVDDRVGPKDVIVFSLTCLVLLGTGVFLFHDGGADEELAEDTPVSMNLFGFTPDFFAYSKEYFKTWLAENRENLKSEFYIPTMVNKLVGEGTASLRVLRSAAQWHGVTYKEDKPALVASIEKMIAEGKYPRNLWA